MRQVTWGLVWILSCMCSALVHGQADLLSRVYSMGVHQYFRGDLYCARETFDRALAHGSRDPRVHYFRGLANLNLGFHDEALSDFRHGATLEVQGAGTFDVDRALERIQGPQRLCLEEIRLQTKLELSLQRPAIPPGLEEGLPPGLSPQTLPGYGQNLPPRGTDPFQDEAPPKVEIIDNGPTTDGPSSAPESVPDGEGTSDEGADSSPFGEPSGPEEAPSATTPTDEDSVTPESSAEDVFADPLGSDAENLVNPFEEQE